jgi:endonuclease/exonuclease/phosphatase family metal-dependent hydrolase
MQLRLMTYNIHKCIGGIDRKYQPERIHQTIAHYQPDVVLLQEVDDGVPRSNKHSQAEWLGDALEFPYRLYQSNVKLRHGTYGNAILSRFPIDRSDDIELTIRPKKRRRALIAKLHVTEKSAQGDGARHTRTVIVTNVHLGLAEFERRFQVKRLLDCETLKHSHHDTPSIIAGDFNDVWQTLAKTLFNPSGFRSAVGKMHTFPAAYPLRCLDGIYYRGTIVPSRVFAGHTELARSASDHLPIIAEFQVDTSSKGH